MSKGVVMAELQSEITCGAESGTAVSVDNPVSESSKQLVKRQLNININEIAKLSIDQMKKLIEIQAKKIDLTKWEYDRFVATCIDSGYLDKGLIVLFNYAGNTDKIEIFTRKYSLSRNSLIEQLKSNENISDLYESINDLAMLTLKLLYAIGSLRKLQCSPKSVTIQYSVDGHEPYALTTQSILRKTAGDFMRLDDVRKSQIANNIGTTALVALLSPILDVFELQNLLSKVNKNVMMQDRQILSTMRTVLDIEDKIEATWMTIQSESTDASKTATNLFPLLRLPYAETAKCDNHFIWFNDVIGSYKGLCNAVLEELNILQNPSSEVSAAPKLTSKPSEGAIAHDPPSSSGKGGKKEVQLLERRNTAGAPTRSKSQSLLALRKPSSPALMAPVVRAPSPLNRKASLSKKSSSSNLLAGSPSQSPARAKSPGGWDSRSTTPNGKNRYKVTASMMYGTTKDLSSYTYDSQDSSGNGGEGDRYGSPSRFFMKTRHNPFTKVAAVSFSPAERMMERDLLKRGFRLAKKKGGGSFEVARRKIKIWWRIVYPRFCFLRRQYLKQFLNEVVLDIADNATTFAIIRTRRRVRWVRERAAVKIQTQFRSWMRHARKELSKISREQRKIVLEANLRAWCVSVNSTCKVLKWFMKVHKKLRKLNPYRRPVSRARCVNGYWNLLQQRNSASLQKTTLSRARFMQYKRERAAVCIQKYVRRLINKNRMLEKHTYLFMKKMLKKFMQRHDIRNKVELRRKRKAATIKIQCAARGFLKRNAMYRRFRSSILIFNFFKKIQAVKNLRKTLRRSERPYTILIDRVSGITEYFDTSEPMRIKLSVWWHPLLHIVSLNDYATVMMTKQPQYIAETKEIYLTPDLDVPADNAVYEKHSPNPGRKYIMTGSMRSTIIFGGDGNVSKSGKYQAVFHESVHIPGCHGNAVIKFEMFTGDRKYATMTHYLNEYGKLMFWNGQYDKPISMIRKTGSNQRVAYQGSSVSRRGQSPSTASVNKDEKNALLHFSIVSPPPSRAKCSWAKVKMRGSGPGKRAMRGKGILTSLLENWVRFFLSTDDEYLMLFESRHSVLPFYKIYLRDMKSVVLENGTATVSSGNSTIKFLSEDNKNIVVSTGSGDKLCLRMGKSGLRVLWMEVLTAVVAHNKVLDDEAAAKVSHDDNFLSSGIHNLTSAFSQKGIMMSMGMSTKFLSFRNVKSPQNDIED